MKGDERIRTAARWLGADYTYVVLAALVGLPILLPALGAVVTYQAWAAQQGWRRNTGRGASFHWRVWWFYGRYLGLYRIDWWIKQREEARNGA